MSLAFALMAPVNGSTGSWATLSHDGWRRKRPPGDADAQTRGVWGPLCRGHNAPAASRRRSPKFGVLPLKNEG